MSPPASDDDAAKVGVIARLARSQKRQSKEFVADLLRMRSLMPLLMKNRNGGQWTAQEKSELLEQMRLLSRLSPYLLLLMLPGSVLLLPIYARWLDRRRAPRRAPAASGFDDDSG